MRSQIPLIANESPPTAGGSTVFLLFLQCRKEEIRRESGNKKPTLALINARDVMDREKHFRMPSEVPTQQRTSSMNFH